MKGCNNTTDIDQKDTGLKNTTLTWTAAYATASGKTCRMPCISAWEGLEADRWPVNAEDFPVNIVRKP